MAALSTESSSLTGLNATYNAVSASDTFTNTENIILHVKNGDASPNTVGVTSPKTVDGLAVGDVSVTVPAGEDRFIGPFRATTFNGTAGAVTVTHTNTTSNTMAVIKVSL